MSLFSSYLKRNVLNKFSYQIKKINRFHNWKLLSARPLTWSQRSLLTVFRSINSYALLFDWMYSVNNGFNGPFSHQNSGTLKPCFFLLTVSADNKFVNAFFIRYFFFKPRILYSEGTLNEYSTKGWSRKGSRASREFIIVIRSTVWLPDKFQWYVFFWLFQYLIVSIALEYLNQ